MKIKNCLNLFIVTLFLAGLLAAADLPEKHPLDNSASRTLVLDNGLKVILVSDPDLNMSSAAMAVDVGSFMDPEETPGLAHFLEHMLFLGTEKFPVVGEYKEYLSQNGGYSNAYTAGDHTNYHFQVFPNAFEGALDRFAQFFIAPLFNEEFAEREINAVDSEHTKNLEDDSWRGQMLFRRHTREGHPENHFSTGNAETLASAKREQLLDFYERYYSANTMALSLVSTQSLDQMEAWVREYFSSVENQNLSPLRYSPDLLEDAKAVRLVKMQAIEERRLLNLYFEMPALRNDWDAKNSEILGSLIGYEGAGSLLSQLKEENLATALGAGLFERSIDYSLLSVAIDLTPSGLENYERVLELMMSYAEMLRESEYPAYFFEEQATMARLADIYSDKGEGARRAESLANRALTLPLEVAEEAPYAFLRKDPDFYFDLVNRITPENMLAILSAKTFEGTQIEPVYGTQYTYSEIEGPFFNRLMNAPLTDGLSLPKPNPFVPESVALLSERPVQLIDEPGLSLYYGQDNEFQRPKVAMTFRMRRPAMDYSARDVVLLDLYEAAVNEYINEIAYDARIADLGYSISAGMSGIQVSAFGYTESAKKLLPRMVDALTSFEIEEALFESVKERIIRSWSNARFDNGFLYIRYLTNKSSYQDEYLPLQKAAAAEGITLKDIYALRDSLFDTGKIEALVYGNMSATEAISTSRMVQSHLDMRATEDDLFKRRMVVLEPGEAITFKDTLPTNNSVFRKDFFMDKATPENRVALAVLANLIEAPYYSEMRTRQQLGYVVWSFAFNRDDEMRLGFVIQSGEYSPIELVERSDALIASFPDLLREMPPEAFAQAREATRLEIEKKAKTIAEKAGKFFNIAYDRDANWSRKEEALAALANLEIDDLVSIAESLNDPDQARSHLVLLFARQLGELADETDAITDIDSWKAGRQFREVTDL